MGKQGLRWLATIFVAILYVCVWQYTQLSGTERKNAAVRTVKIMTSTAMSVDSRLNYVFKLIDADEVYKEKILKLFALTQDDFELAESPVKLDGAIPYRLALYNTMWTLSVNYNYYLENISMNHKQLKYVADFNMIETDALLRLPNGELRDVLDLSTSEYVYQSDGFILGNDTSVKIVVNIAKPYFYDIIYPVSLSDYIKLITYIAVSFFLTYMLILNMGTYRGNQKTAYLARRIDNVTGLYNRVKLDEYFFKEGDVILLISLTPLDEKTPLTREVLTAFSANLHRASRINDCIIKLSDGEFAIILPNASSRAIESIVSRLRKSSDINFIAGHATYALGMSRSELMSSADQELRNAKTKK